MSQVVPNGLTTYALKSDIDSSLRMSSMITKLLKLLQSQGPIGTARHILHAIRSRYRNFFDETLFDWQYGTETSLIEKEDLFSTVEHGSEDFQFYEAIKWHDFRRMVNEIPASPFEQFTFIDFGGGKGRALMFASKAGFNEIIGVELSERLVEIAKNNIALFQVRTSYRPEIDVVLCGASQFAIPDQELVIFFHNPFVEETMSSLVSRIADAQREFEKSIYVLYRNPVCHEILVANHAFQSLEKNSVYAIYSVHSRI